MPPSYASLPILAAVLLGGICQAAPLIQMYYEARPPLTADAGNGVPAGLVGTPAVAAVRRAGLPVQYLQMPYLRHMELIEQNRVLGCAIGRFKTEERARLGKFSRPIYRDGQFVALLRVGDEARSLAGLLARPGVRVLVREGYSYGPALDGAMAGSHVAVQRTYDSSANMLRMLASGMADLMFASEEEARSLLDDNPALRSRVMLRRLPDMPLGENRYFFCSRQVPDATLAKLNAALEAGTAP